MEARNRVEIDRLKEIAELYAPKDQADQLNKFRQEVHIQQHIRLKQFIDHYIPLENIISDTLDYKVQKLVNDTLESGYSAVFYHKRDKPTDTKDNVRDRVFAKVDHIVDRGYQELGKFSISAPRKNPNHLAFELALEVLYPYIDVKKLDKTLDSYQRKHTELLMNQQKEVEKETNKQKLKR